MVTVPHFGDLGVSFPGIRKAKRVGWAKFTPRGASAGTPFKWGKLDKLEANPYRRARFSNMMGLGADEGSVF